MEDIREIKQELQNIKQEQKDMQRDIRSLETRTTVNEREITNINKQLEKISSNTTWILYIIIDAIVVGLIGLLMKGANKSIENLMKSSQYQ